jgi:hypothetical protein
MTFTYGEDLTDDADFVRFHTGDVVEGENFLSDGIITSLLATSASREAAVIASLRHIILRLSQPNFKADWLQVDSATARTGYETALADKMKEFGFGKLAVVVRNTYRADSAQTTEPDFSGGRPGLEDDEDFDTL